MLRYKTEIRPGLVALYNIRPGNGASQFLQPRSPHGAHITVDHLKMTAGHLCLICLNTTDHRALTLAQTLALTLAQTIHLQ